MRLDSTHATFLMFSGATYVEVEKALHREFVVAKGKSSARPDAIVSRTTFDMSQIDYSEMSPKDLDFLLMCLHERDHFDHFISSPVGLLLYRSYLTLTVTLTWLFQRFFIPGGLADEVGGRPFVDWIKTDALSWIERRFADGIIELDRAWAVPPPLPEYAGVLGYLEHVALPELTVLSDFLRALLGRPSHVTLGEFADLANRAFRHLSWRCEVPVACRWVTEMPEMLLHPPGDAVFSVTELFELCAIAREKKALRACNAPALAIKDWAASYDCDPYRRGLNLEKVSRFPIEFLSEMAALALGSPCDLAVCPDGDILVEHMHPSWRFKSFYFFLGDARTCPRTGLSITERLEKFNAHKVGDWHAVEETLCVNSFVGCLPMLRAVLDKKSDVELIGRDANILPVIEADTDIHMGRAVRDMLLMFREAIHAAASDDTSIISAIRERLTYFKDEAAFPSVTDENDVRTVLTVHGSCVIGYLYLVCLFDGLHASNVPPWDKAFFARLNRLAPINAVIEESLSIRTIALEIFGRDFAEAMGFS